jgi:hypothetical protein
MVGTWPKPTQRGLSRPSWGPKIGTAKTATSCVQSSSQKPARSSDQQNQKWGHWCKGLRPQWRQPPRPPRTRMKSLWLLKCDGTQWVVSPSKCPKHRSGICWDLRLGSVTGHVIQATGRSEFEDGLGSGDFVSDYSYHMSVCTRLPDITKQTKFQRQRPSDV